MAIAADIILETGALTEEFSGFGAVNNVNLRVRAGTIHALIGPNGAGKTICFNLITKFLQPTAGAIRFKGEDITLRFRHGGAFRRLAGVSPPDINNWPHPGRLACRCADEAIGAVRKRKRYDCLAGISRSPVGRTITRSNRSVVLRDNQGEKACCLTEECSHEVARCLIKDVPIAS